MDKTDVNQLPRPLREALLRAFESLLDLHDTLLQVYPAQPTAPYPRSALEVLCLDALTAIAPLPATSKQVAAMIGKPDAAIQRILFSLETLGTIYRPTKGYYSLVKAQLPTLAGTPPDEPGRSSAHYAARIARIVAQERSRETTISPAQEASGARQREAASHSHTPTHEKGTAHD